MQRRKQRLFGALALAFAAGITAPLAARAEPLVASIDGNDCAGVFGQSFGECRLPSIYDPGQSPVIAKFDSAGGGSWEFNSALFPTVSADDFSIVYGADGSGSFTYLPDAGDPLITFFVAKGGNAFNLFRNDGDPNAGSFFTPTNGGGRSPGLSHLTFFDTGSGGGALPAQDIPEPGTLALLALGLFSVAFMRREGTGRERLFPARSWTHGS